MHSLDAAHGSGKLGRDVRTVQKDKELNLETHLYM